MAMKFDELPTPADAWVSCTELLRERARAEAAEAEVFRVSAERDEALTSRDKSLAEAELLRAGVRKAEAERDAVIAWAAEYAARVDVALEDEGPRAVGYKAPSHTGYVWATTPEAAIRKASGLDRPPGDRGTDAG